MSSPVLQLGNANNWESHYSGSFEAARITVNSRDIYLPILEVEVPITFDKNVLAVYAASATAKPNWSFAGYASQRIRTGLIVGGSHDSVAARKSIWLNEINLLFFDQLASSYSLSIKPAKWLHDISINIWQYTGNQSDTVTDLLQTIHTTTNQILAELT